MNKNTTLFSAVLLLVYLCTSCTKMGLQEEFRPKKLQASIVSPLSPISNIFIDSVQYEQIPESDKRFILALDEPTSTVVNSDIRSFNTKEFIQVQPKGGNKFTITSYSAAPIYNIDFYCQLQTANGLSDWFLLFTIDSLPGFGQFEYQPKFTIRETIYKTEKGESISLNHPSVKKGEVNIKVKTEDKHYAMLQTIKSDWNLSFSNFHWNGSTEDGSWREMRAIYAREWVIIITNFAYMIAQPEFKHILEKYNTVLGGDLYGNKGTKDVFTPQHYEQLYQSLISKRTLRLGRTGVGGGLGGGSTYGIDHWNFYSHYSSASGWNTIAHELAHCLGYGHSSNMTYGNAQFGFADGFIPQLHSYFRRRNNLPYTKPELLGFINPKNQKYWAQGIALDLTIPSNKENRIDEYFKKNPLK